MSFLFARPVARPRVPQIVLTIALTIVGALLTPMASSAIAQTGWATTPTTPTTPAASTPSRLSGHQAFYLGTNIAIGAVQAGVRARLAHQRILPALVAGASSGVTTYAGMRGVGTGTPTLRFVGLQTVALSASVADNVSRGARWDDRFTLPFYPLLVTWRPHAARPIGLRLSGAATTSALALGLTRRWHLRPDWATTLSSGTLVFRAPGRYVARHAGDEGCVAAGTCPDDTLYGFSSNGIAFATAASGVRRAALAHEFVHVAQFTREEILAGDPASAWVLAQAGAPGRWLGRWVTLDAFRPVWAASAVLGPAGRSAVTTYIELEAEAMRGQDPCAIRSLACRW